MSKAKLKPVDEYRQSLLQGMTICPRRTRFSLERDGDLTTGYMEWSADLGTMFHAFADRYIRTLWRYGEEQMSTEEACVIMREVMAESHIVLPSDEADELRWMVLGFCNFRWNTKRIMALERKLTADIVCPDGITRVLKGTPDVIMSDPPEGGIIRDYKSGRGKPRTPRGHQEGQPIEGMEYLSERGHFQLDTYGLLAMRNWPSFQYVTLEEIHLRSGEVRRATLSRAALEHVEHQLAIIMMKVDEGIQAGPKSPIWRPKPGAHCQRQCPVARSCPVPREQRGDGQIATHRQADDLARAVPVLTAQRKQALDALKAHHEQTGYCPQVGDGTVYRWDPPVGVGRKFGAFPPLAQQEEEAA